ncbi:MAG: porin [Vicinamibacteria bacterium]
MSPEIRLSRCRALSAALVLSASAAWAQDPAPSPAPEPPKVDVSGFVDAYYGYNFNQVDPAFRTFDVQHNAFSLSLAEVAFSKPVTADSRVGFRVDLDFGKTADLVAAFEPESDGSEIYKHLQQGYVSLLTDKVTWDVGRFVTPIGAEVIESQDNWNYTRSILFGYAIPFNHTGVRATYAASDKASFAAFLLNGWNAGSEINGDKTFAVNATLKPSPRFTWYLNYMGGKEVADGDTRHLVDTTASLALSDKLTVMGNFDYGKEGDVKWWGAAGYAKYQATPEWALVGRYEYVDDTEGGFMLLGTTGQSLTVTSDHTVAGALKARLEYRTDFADAELFPKDDGSFKKSQTSLTVGLVVGFGGKI